MSRPLDKDEIAIGLRALRENLPSQIELQVLLAQITRAKFLALVKEGFSEEQAIQLCREAK